MVGHDKQDQLNRVKGILLRDHAKDARVTDLLGDFAASRMQESDVPPESSPEPQDVPPESSPEPDVPQESSPDEEPQEEPSQEQHELTNKELNFARLREERDAEKFKRETLELELSKLKRQQLEELDKRRDDDRVKQIDTYLNERLPENFEEMDEREKFRTIGRIAAVMNADEKFGAKDELREMANEWNVMKHLPGLQGQQVSMVAQIVDSAKGALQPHEALAVAQARDPKLFAAQAPASPTAATVPQSHRVMEPSREGRGRVPVDEGEQLQQAYYAAAVDGGNAAKKRALTALVKHKLGKHPGVLPG
jgi:hypothetical protein